MHGVYAVRFGAVVIVATDRRSSRHGNDFKDFTVYSQSPIYQKKQWVAVFWGSSSTSGELIPWYSPNPGKLNRGGSKRARGAYPSLKPRVIFFTNIILHRRVLFYTFTDITVMLLSRDSLY